MGLKKTNLIYKATCAMLALVPAFAGSTAAQGTPNVAWQAAQAGNSIAFSPDGQMLLSATKLWRVSDGTLIRTFLLPFYGSGVNSVGFSPDGQLVAIGLQAFNQNLDILRVADGALIAGRISAHSNGTTSVAFSPDGQFLATGGRDGTARLWHLPDMTLVHTFNGGVGYRARVFAVSFSKDGQLLAVGGQGGVQLFRTSDGTLVEVPRGASSTVSLSISPDGQILAAGSNATDQYGQCVDCSTKFWRLSDGTPLGVIDGNNNGILSIAFAPDGQFIAAGSGDRVYSGVARVWRISDGVLVRNFNQDPNNPSSYVTSVAYSPDGSLLAFARADGLLVVTRNSVPACAPSISPSGQSFPSTGGSASVSVTTGAGCSWNAASNVSWVSIYGPNTGSGSNTVAFSVAENTTGNPRGGTMTVAGQTFNVNQDGASCTYSISPTSGSFSAGGGSGSLQVMTTSGCAWQATPRASWITITSPVSGTGKATLSFSLASNRTGVTRRGTITVAGQVFSIKQRP